MAKDRDLISLAKENRKNATLAERKIWKIIRNNQLGVKFKRQFQIGRYIVDFASVEIKLVIECDGGQHDENKEKDDARTAYLNSLGYKVLRFWNNEIFKYEEGVYLSIQNDAEERKRLCMPPHPNPLPRRGEEKNKRRKE